MFWTLLVLLVGLMVLWGWYSSNLILRQKRSPNALNPLGRASAGTYSVVNNP